MVYYGIDKKINFDHDFLYKHITKTSQLFEKYLRAPTPKFL